MGVVHRGEEVRLLEIEALRVAFEQGDEVGDRPALIEARARLDGVADGGVQGPAPGQRLLDQVPAREPPRAARAPRTGARQRRQRVGVDVVALEVREHGQQAPARRADARPRPADEQPDLGQVVLVRDRRDARRPRAARASRAARRRVTAPVVTSALLTSSASGFQRSSDVSAATRGNGLRPAVDQRRARPETRTHRRAGSGAP